MLFPHRGIFQYSHSGFQNTDPQRLRFQGVLQEYSNSQQVRLMVGLYDLEGVFQPR